MPVLQSTGERLDLEVDCITFPRSKHPASTGIRGT